MEVAYWVRFSMSVSGSSIVSLSYSASPPPSIQLCLPRLPKFCPIK